MLERTAKLPRHFGSWLTFSALLESLIMVGALFIVAARFSNGAASAAGSDAKTGIGT
ncbi:MAG: hypothetical protein FWH06_03115 [Oscillospiraceae bacterium]|nr:hypothetical protein [Oscillospiraceae bacterium]